MHEHGIVLHRTASHCLVTRQTVPPDCFLRVVNVKTGVPLWDRPTPETVQLWASGPTDDDESEDDTQMLAITTASGGEETPTVVPASTTIACPLCTTENSVFQSMCKLCGRPITLRSAQHVRKLAEELGLYVVIRHKSQGKRSGDSKYRRKAKNHLKRAKQIGWDTIKARFRNDAQYREQLLLYKITDKNIDEFEALSVSEAKQEEIPWTARSRKFGVRKRTAVVGMEDRGVWEQVQQGSVSSQSTWQSNSWWSDPYTLAREKPRSEHAYQ